MLGGGACLVPFLPMAARPASADLSNSLPGNIQAGSFLYSIIRGGDPIGIQRQEFRFSGQDKLSVLTNVEINVRLLGISLFRFTQDIEENWLSGRLETFHSVTDDDGEPRRVELKRAGERLVGTYNGKSRDLPGDIIPSTLWHPDSVRQTVVLDTIKGRARKVSVKDMGLTEADLPAGKKEAHHFVFSGELNRELWYGLEGGILAAEMTAKDGSLIRQELNLAG
jgi:Family of unknown function (DUF6134)